MTTRPKAAKVSNVEEGIISDSDLNIGRFMNKKQNRNLRLVSKAFNQAFLNNLKNLKCADAQELQEESVLTTMWSDNARSRHLMFKKTMIGFAATYRDHVRILLRHTATTNRPWAVGGFFEKNGTLLWKSSKENAFTIQRRTMALRTWISTLDCQEVRDEAAPASAWRAFLRALAQSRSTFDFGMDHF